jgi:enterochelin esterase-like enzyme
VTPKRLDLIVTFFLLASSVLSACRLNVNSSVHNAGAAALQAEPSLELESIPTATASPKPATPTNTLVPSPTASPVPSATPTTLACWSQGGRLEKGSLRSKYVPLPLEYIVYLPPCYDQQTERHYPVLYLIHGQNYNNDQWVRLGAGETADALIAAVQVAPFIIIMPRDRSWTQPSVDGFGQALINDLLPWVDKHYRTLPSRMYRAIGGLSRGAGWAVHLGLSHWELFSILGAHSLPVFWEDTSHVRAWLDAIPMQSMPRIYMDTGEKDYLIQSTLWFEGILDQKGIPHEWYLFPGYHEEAYWHAHIEQYIRWYARDW